MFAETLPFFNLSVLSGVKELSQEQDANSDPIELPDIGILFGDKFIKEAYVSVPYTILPEIFSRVLFSLNFAVGVGPRKLSLQIFLRR